MRQLHLFETILREIRLEADSKKKAFYILRLIECRGAYSIEKISGAGGKILDRRRWPMPSLPAAEKRFNRTIKSKLNPDRNNPRKYREVPNDKSDCQYIKF